MVTGKPTLTIGEGLPTQLRMVGVPDPKPNRSETLTRVPVFSGLSEAELSFLAERTVPRQFSLSPTATPKPRSFMPRMDAISACWNFSVDSRCKFGIPTVGRAGTGEPSTFGETSPSANKNINQTLFRILPNTPRI